MARTRAAVIDGTQRAVEKYGSRKTTMADVAALAGVAKATLYNHFRTKRDVYAATLEAEVQALGSECAALAADEGLPAALARAAERLGSHATLRRIALDESAVLARLATPADSGAWSVARRAVTTMLAAAGRAASPAEVELVLRWLVTHIGAPAGAAELAVGARAISAGLTQGSPAPMPGWHAGHQ
ncbi:MAG: TetR/AcrR family transcriptional regulator, transcriptional repressor of aconitase [Frankiales bacterium]|jgi:AcrR family transcriptional regulator|nr:TetR/AcrR family transcriptional regulator, transcriptional repressor of aconitase [Frankiales bacterium]